MIRHQNFQQAKSCLKTAQPMFRRIDNNMNDTVSRVSKTSKQSRNFPSLSKSSVKPLLKKSNSMDTFNQNMTFQTYFQKIGHTKIDQKLIVSNYLNFLRKDYDKMYKQIKEQSSSINLKKKDIQFIKQRVRIQQQATQSLSQKIGLKEQQMKKIEQKQLQAQTQRKTLDHIIYRMKKDQIFYKQYGTIHEGHINQKTKTVKTLKEILMTEDQKIHKLLMTIEQMKKSLEENQHFRHRKLQDYCQRLQNIHQKQLFIQQRKQRTLQLQSIQSNDILAAKNVQMRNICLINKIADCLFENKIQKLIKSYEHIQNAFHTIQVKTSITDPTMISSKFFSYEELTQNLLKTISGYEKNLQLKVKRNQQLKDKYKKLQQKNYTNDQILQMQQNRNKKTYQQIQEINERHLTYQRILQWVQKTGKKFKLGLQDRNNDVARKLLTICEKTKTQMSELQKNIKPSEKKYITAGIRIKKLIKQVTLDAKTQKLKQAQQTQQSILMEQEYLRASRAGVKRNFLIKQRTMNIGNLHTIKQSKNENDKKYRASDNR